MAQPLHAQTLTPAFATPVFDAAHTFRAILTAMSRPGTIVAVDAPATPPAPIHRAMAAVILTLCDLDTPVWLAPAMTDQTGAWCDFHTGAPRVSDPADAALLFAPSGDAPNLMGLDAGTEAYPDRSATLVLECQALGEGPRYSLTGPGIQSERTLAFDGLPRGFLDAWAENRARFPRGVDVVLTCRDRLAALPRTTRIQAAG